jgi:hypothetical protein
VFESSDPYIGRKRYCLHTGNRLIRLLALKISCWLLVEPTPLDKFNGVRLFDLHAGVQHASRTSASFRLRRPGKVCATDRRDTICGGSELDRGIQEAIDFFHKLDGRVASRRHTGLKLRSGPAGRIGKSLRVVCAKANIVFAKKQLQSPRQSGDAGFPKYIPQRPKTLRFQWHRLTLIEVEFPKKRPNPILSLAFFPTLQS